MTAYRAAATKPATQTVPYGQRRNEQRRLQRELEAAEAGKEYKPRRRGDPRWCLNGHDKDATGRYGRGQCKQCVLDRGKERRIARKLGEPPPTKRKHRKASHHTPRGENGELLREKQFMCRVCYNLAHARARGGCAGCGLPWRDE